MIIDQLKNASLYTALNERISAGLNYLQTTDFTTLAPGRYELDGSNLFALVQHYDSRLPEQGKWEAHRKYIDIQYVLSGEELIGFATLDQMTPGVYDEAKDFLPMQGPASMVKVPAGCFMILFPEDAHMPCMAVTTPQPVKKVVVKVRI